MDHVSRVGLFLKVVKHQSFAAAARELGMTGPALSKQVQSLEDQLGVRLLHRTTRLVTLTEEGAVYSEKARKALEDLEEAEQQLQEMKACPTGLLKVNVPVSFGVQYLAKPIAGFAKKYPDVYVDVNFDDRNVDVIAEGYDVVVRIGVLKDSSLIVRQLARCPKILCASATSANVDGLPQSPEELKDYNYIAYNNPDAVNEWHYRDKDGNIGSAQFTRAFSSNRLEMILEACLQGKGMSQLPIFAVAPYLKSGELVQVMPDYETYPERGIYAIFPQNRHLSTRVRLFIDWLTECSKDFPWMKE